MTVFVSGNGGVISPPNGRIGIISWRWISVEDLLPEMKKSELKHEEGLLISEKVLAFDGKDMLVAWRWAIEISGESLDESTYFTPTHQPGCVEYGEITHWMPLPKPPETK